MGDDKPCFHAEPAHQFDRMFDALAFDHTGRLKNEPFIRVESQRIADIAGIVVRRRGGMFEIHHVWNNGGRYTRPEAELVARRGTDDDMANRRKMRRKSHIEIIPDPVCLELLALPEKIVMMGDGGQTGLRDELGDCQPERDVQRYGHRVFRYQEIDVELSNKFV